MCIACWEREGSPTALPANAAEFTKLFDQLYEIEAAGGPLHSVLDDWNLDGEIEPYPGLDCDDDVYALCGVIARLMNDMTVPERQAALAAAEGWFDPAIEECG